MKLKKLYFSMVSSAYFFFCISTGNGDELEIKKTSGCKEEEKNVQKRKKNEKVTITLQ